MYRSFINIKKLVSEPFIIAFYGASTTSQESIFPNWVEIMRYVLKYSLEEGNFGEYKEKFWNLQTLNLALDGATSRDLLRKFDEIVMKRNPSMIFLEEGKNDLHLGIESKDSEENNRKMIKKALDAGLKVVLFSTIPSVNKDLNKKIERKMEVDKNLLEEFGSNLNFLFVNLFELFPKDMLPEIYTLISEEGNEDMGIEGGGVDFVHYNKLGNAIVAKILLKQVFNIDFDEKVFLKDLENKTKQFPNY